MTTPTAELIRRPGIVTLLAVLHFIGAAVALATGLGLIAASLAAVEEENTLLVVGIGAAFAGVGLLQLTTGVGLWTLKPYGRTLQLILASIGLLGVPIGTIISICILVYMCKPGIKALFSGKRPTELTPVELEAIARVTTGSAATTVLIVVLLGLGGIMAVGIIAAVAIPGLLRARMAGNEASAIAALRTVNSAQVSYSVSAAKGGYAVSLAVLGAPCPGASQGFVSSDLAHDPSTRNGFVIALASAGAPAGPLDCNAVPTELDYYATATPETVTTTGTRSFSTSKASTIFFDTGGVPPSERATLSGTAKPVQ